MKLLLILLHLLIFPVYLTAQQVLIDEEFKGDVSILQTEESKDIIKRKTKNEHNVPTPPRSCCDTADTPNCAPPTHNQHQTS